MRELRILTIGNSTTFMVALTRESIHDASFPELLPECLAAQGIPALTMRSGQWYGMVNEAVRREESFRDLMPHVVIISLGMAECQQNVLPTWMNRHFTSWDVNSRAVARWYRKRIARPLWKRARDWQRLASKVVGQRTHRLSPKRFEIGMHTLIKLLRNDLKPLVLVLDLDPPNDRVYHWLPGITARAEHYNRILKSVVESFEDPEVRLIEASHLVHELGSKEILPDGLHRSARGHRLVAEELAAEIAPWAKATFEGQGR